MTIPSRSASFGTPPINVHLPKRHTAQHDLITTARRFNVAVCGRRFGKTTLGLDVLTTEPRGLLEGFPCAWFAPNSKLFDEVWIEAKRMLADVTTRADSQKNRIDLITGAHLDFWTLHNTDDPGRGRKYSRVVLDEAAIVPSARLERQWQEAIRATLTDYEGSAWFLSTPKGPGFFEALFQRGQDERYPEWMSWQLPSSRNPALNPAEIDAARQELPAAVFHQEYLAEFIHEFGAVFKQPALYDPSELPAGGYREATGCDFAYTSKAGDWTVFLEGRHADGITYVTRLYREQVEATAWAIALRDFPSPFAFIGGQESGITAFLKRDYGVRIRSERAVTDKLARAMPAATAWNRGEIRLPARAPLTTLIERETLAFTGDDRVDAHDDIVDALAALHYALVGKARTNYAAWKEALGTR